MAQCGGDLLSRRLHQETTVEGLCQGLLDLDEDMFGAMCSAVGYLQEWPDVSGTNLGVAAPDAGNANGDDSCSGGGVRKRKTDSCLDAKSDHSDGCKRPRAKQQLISPSDPACEIAGKGKEERAKAGTKKKAEVAAGQKTDYIHVRARRGQATDSHSLAERVRRERISERMRFLQELVPGCSKVTGKAGMLDEIINYVQSLQKQVEFLSMKIAASNPVVSFDIVEDLFGRQLKQACDTAAPPALALPDGQLQQSCVQMSPMQQVHLHAGSFGFGLEMVVNSPYPPAAADGSNVSCLDVNGAAATAVWNIASQNFYSGFDAQFQPLESDCLLDSLKMEM